jgi:arylsulfatase A-like enzyme
MSGRSFAPLLRGDTYLPRTHVFAERGYHGNGAINENTAASTFDLSRCARSASHKLICNYTPKQRYMPVDSARDAGWQQMLAAHQEGRLSPAHDRAYFSDPRPMTELYDLEADPAELRNLAGQPDHAAVERALKEALHEKMLLDGDYLPLPLSE